MSKRKESLLQSIQLINSQLSDLAHLILDVCEMYPSEDYFFLKSRLIDSQTEEDIKKAGAELKQHKAIVSSRQFPYKLTKFGRKIIKYRRSLNKLDL